MAGSSKGLLAKGVPPNAPRWLFFVQIAIIVLSIIVLGLAAWAISIAGGNSIDIGGYGNGSAGLAIFVVIKSWIVYGLAIGLQMAAPQFFFRIVFIIAFGLSVIFWLSTWAYSASEASGWMKLCNNTGPFAYCGSALKNEGSALAGVAAIGAVIWILSIVNLVFFALAALHDPEFSGPTAHQAELGKVDQGVYPSQPVQQPVQQQAYPQQQQYPPQQQYAPAPQQQTYTTQ